MIAAFWWLALLVGFLACLIVPTWFYERWLRSDYRAYLKHQKALKAQREEYVPPQREAREHTLTVVRAGQVR